MRGKLLFIGTGAFATGVVCRTLFVIPWQFVVLTFFVAILSSIFSLFEKNIITVALGVALIACSCGIIRTSFVPNSLPSDFAPLMNEQVSLAGIIVADPDIREKNQQLIVEVHADSPQENQKTFILVFAPLSQHFTYGEQVTVAGTLSAPTPFTTDGGRVFRYDNFLAKKEIFSMIMKAKVTGVAPPSGMWDSIADFLFSIKHDFVAGLTRALPSPYNDLATGLLTGDQHQLGDTIENVLAISGLIWVVVLSGYHVTLIAEAILGIFSFLPKRLSLIMAAIGVLAIVFATGGSAPSIRGGAMAGFTLFARGTGRTYDAIRALCVTLILILLWSPYLLAYDFGFELSIVVTPALILGTPILEMHMLWIKEAFIREIISVSVVAQLACLPLILWQTGQLGLWAIPANMLVMPLVPVSMLLSFIAGCIGTIAAPLAPLFGLPAYAILYYILTIANISASLPYASVIIPAFPFVFVLIMYGTLVFLFRWLQSKQPR